MKFLAPPAVLVTSPVLLIAGAPIRRRYLRYVYPQAATQILDKERGRVSAHYFVVTNPLHSWSGLPARESLARRIDRRG
ncbi:hypothetical protein ABT275_35310 [Streptomyces sp. NPDC001185]|uniref:hypothetical protein n=1 Tax=Streptomyces sp. NPDC001185 TaxID=3154380 RepID=UPI00332AA536